MRYEIVSRIAVLLCEVLWARAGPEKAPIAGVVTFAYFLQS